MTNAQKWVAAFLGLFLLLFLLQKATEEEDVIIDEVEFYGDSQKPEQEMEALSLINKMNCTSCHGVDLKGSNLAPSLYSAKEYWSRNKLINYLRNPISYSGDERFENYKKQFNNNIMPSFSSYDVKELGIVADYILQLTEE